MGVSWRVPAEVEKFSGAADAATAASVNANANLVIWRIVHQRWAACAQFPACRCRRDGPDDGELRGTPEADPTNQMRTGLDPESVQPRRQNAQRAGWETYAAFSVGHVAAAESSHGLIPCDENPRRNSLKLKHKIARAVRARSMGAPPWAQRPVPSPTTLNLGRELSIARPSRR
jgi:hypothetical protein